MSLDVSPAIVAPAKEASTGSSDTNSTVFAEKADQPEAFVTLLSNKLSETSPPALEKDTDLPIPEHDLVTDIHVDLPDSSDMATSALLTPDVDTATNQINNSPTTPADVTIQALLAMLPHQIANTLEQKNNKNQKTEQDTVIKKPHRPNSVVPEQIQQNNKSPGVMDPETVWLNRVNSHPSDTITEFTRFSETSGNTGQERISFQPTTHPALLPASRLFTESGALNTTPTTVELHASLGSKEWQQTLGQQVLLFSRNGQQNAQLRLHPQDLGTVQVRLSLEDNMAQLHFTSAQVQVRAALEAAMPGLRNALAEGGIHLGQSTVSSDTAPQWQQAEQDPDRMEENDHPEIITHSMAQKSFETPAALESLAAGKNTIDVFA